MNKTQPEIKQISETLRSGLDAIDDDTVYALAGTDYSCTGQEMKESAQAFLEFHDAMESGDPDRELEATKKLRAFINSIE